MRRQKLSYLWYGGGSKVHCTGKHSTASVVWEHQRHIPGANHSVEELLANGASHSMFRKFIESS